MKKFTIDDRYLDSVIVRKSRSMYAGKTELTEEQLIKVLKGEDRCSSMSSIDHPEFTLLREQLGKDGYITIERGWWNGDRVTKPFILNDFKFNKGDQFCCASAMEIHIRLGKKYAKTK